MTTVLKNALHWSYKYNVSLQMPFKKLEDKIAKFIDAWLNSCCFRVPSLHTLGNLPCFFTWWSTPQPMSMHKETFPSSQASHWPYSKGHGHCSTYPFVNCMQYGGFPCKVHAKNLSVNFTQALTRRLFARKFACISLQQQIWLTQN